MSITIAALVAMAASAAAEAAPVIQQAASDFLRENLRNGNIKTFVKCTDWNRVNKNVKDGVKVVSDYANYKDNEGGWNKK